MKLVEKLRAKQDIYNGAPITVAFLGDSVTQGCFECYTTSETSLQTVFDYRSAYGTRMREILNILYPEVQINIIDSGLSGDNAANGLNRLDRDIFPFSPDLVVVSYGLNDAVVGGIEEIEKYSENLACIFDELNKRNIEWIFLTQNYMCTKTSPHLKDKLFVDLSVDFARVQNEGILKKYFSRAKETAEEKGGKVCDLYSVWERMAQSGIDTSELLANKLNHPIREIHYYMAIKLIETIFEV